MVFGTIHPRLGHLKADEMNVVGGSARAGLASCAGRIGQWLTVDGVEVEEIVGE